MIWLKTIPLLFSRCFWGVLTLYLVEFGVVQTNRDIGLGFSWGILLKWNSCVFSAFGPDKHHQQCWILSCPSPETGAWNTVSSSSLPVAAVRRQTPQQRMSPGSQLCKQMLYTPNVWEGCMGPRLGHRYSNKGYVWPRSSNVTSRCLSLPWSPNRRGFLQQTKGRHENASPRASDRGDVRCLSLFILCIAALLGCLADDVRVSA